MAKPEISRDITKTYYPSAPEPGSSGRTFCTIPSDAYLEMVDQMYGDPKSAVGQKAINESGAQAKGGWKPAWEARERIES